MRQKRERKISLANFFGKIIDYRRNGPGVQKQTVKTYTLRDFWRTYFAKFFKLLGLNVLYCACLIVVVLLCCFPLNRLLSTSDPLTDKLAGYELSAEFRSLLSSYAEAYKFDEATIDRALPSLESALNRIQKVNPDLLKDGTSAFNSKAYSDEDKEAIRRDLEAGFSAFSFVLSEGEEAGSYTLSDDSGRIVATCVITENTLTLSDSLPRSVMDLVRVILCLAPLILLSPIQLAVFRITRDYVQGSPSFMMSDLWDTIKKNWWQSLVLGVLTYISFSVVGISLMWYWSYFENGWFFKIGLCLCLCLAYVLISMSLYAGIMQVSLDTGLGKILKNAFYFSVICLWKNLFMILISFLMVTFLFFCFIFGMANSLIMSLTFTLVFIGFFSFWFFFISFMTYPSILKYIVEPYYAQLKQQQQEEKQEQESSSSVEREEKSEYVYHNGRMVHRSVLEQESLFSDETPDR